jgi:hypothetical protein
MKRSAAQAELQEWPSSATLVGTARCAVRNEGDAGNLQTDARGSAASLPLEVVVLIRVEMWNASR